MDWPIAEVSLHWVEGVNVEHNTQVLNLERPKIMQKSGLADTVGKMYN